MKLNFSRLALFALLAAALLGLGLARPAPAAADQPTREFLPAGWFDGYVWSGLCDFDVQTFVLTNKEYIKVFSNRAAEERMDLVTGVFKAKLVNVSNPDKFMEVNSSSASQTHYNADGSGRFRLQGTTLMLGENPWGVPALSLVTGQLEDSWDGAGHDTYAFHGHATDLCPLLGD